MVIFTTRLCLKRALPTILIALVCIEAFGSNTSDAATPPKRLLVSLDYVVPEYRPDAKFRSPATIDTALAEDLAKRLQRPLATFRNEQARAGLRLTTLTEVATVLPAQVVIPISYAAAPMAIMRSDTTIKRWPQLKNRTVCVAQGGHQVGTIAAQYGAVEKIYPALTDALIALRTGACDALVHDSPMLEELIKLPEWKKFSAQLPAGQRSMLAFVVPAGDKKTIATLRQVTADWNAHAYPDALMKTTVRNIAFEVYLEQNVPDCH